MYGKYGVVSSLIESKKKAFHFHHKDAESANNKTNYLCVLCDSNEQSEWAVIQGNKGQTLIRGERQKKQGGSGLNIFKPLNFHPSNPEPLNPEPGTPASHCCFGIRADNKEEKLLKNIL